MLIFYHHQLSKISSSYKEKKRFNFYLVRWDRICRYFWLNGRSYIFIFFVFYFLHNLSLFPNNVFLYLSYFWNIVKQIMHNTGKHWDKRVHCYEMGQPFSSYWSLSLSPEIIRKPSGSLMFSGGKERDQWHGMGYYSSEKYFFTVLTYLFPTNPFSTPWKH